MNIFSGLPLTPHGFCLAWDPWLMALHVVSDAMIALSYYAISALLVLLMRRRELAFGWMIGAFAVFILACGTTHFYNIITLWFPDYVGEGLVKAFTAVVSLATAIWLWPLIPKLVALPSPGQLASVNQALLRQIDEYNDVVAALRQETADRVRTEAMLRQSQKMDAIGHLTGGLAHDFNNLLMIIRGNVEALEDRLEDAAASLRRYVARALAAADRAATLTQQMLAFARRQSLEPTVFDVNQRIEAMADMLRATLATVAVAPISLTLRCSPDPCLVETDPHQLEAALLNLAINARDAMPKGGVLTIDTARIVHPGTDAAPEEEISPGPYVRIAVADTGEGMSAEVMHAAFEPFFTTKPVGQGSGLGLSQVYGFVHQSRGSVSLRSEPGRGTTVILDLPGVIQPGD